MMAYANEGVKQINMERINVVEGGEQRLLGLGV